jgi:hypothetical protein
LPEALRTIVRDGHGPQINEAFDVLLSQSRKGDGIVKVSIRIKDDWVLVRAAAASPWACADPLMMRIPRQHY